MAVLLLSGCSGPGWTVEPVVGRVTVAAGAGSRTPAAPDPAPPDPAPPDPAAPDPAPPDPAAPDPAADRGTPDPQPAVPPEPATVTVSPMVAACADVVDALTDAVAAYEVVALAEGGGRGDRAATAAEMRTAWRQAEAAAARGGGGLPRAAAAAMTAVTVLHDGLTTRDTLDESDADPWRDAREDLQDWCRAQP